MEKYVVFLGATSCSNLSKKHVFWLLGEFVLQM
jgi:hypothetical protein